MSCYASMCLHLSAPYTFRQAFRQSAENLLNQSLCLCHLDSCFHVKIKSISTKKSTIHHFYLILSKFKIMVAFCWNQEWVLLLNVWLRRAVHSGRDRGWSVSAKVTHSAPWVKTLHPHCHRLIKILPFSLPISTVTHHEERVTVGKHLSVCVYSSELICMTDYWLSQ